MLGRCARTPGVCGRRAAACSLARSGGAALRAAAVDAPQGAPGRPCRPCELRLDALGAPSMRSTHMQRTSMHASLTRRSPMLVSAPLWSVCLHGLETLRPPSVLKAPCLAGSGEGGSRWSMFG
eukprot:366278-Chlamydomonas_euryale.AAC.40